MKTRSVAEPQGAFGRQMLEVEEIQRENNAMKDALSEMLSHDLDEALLEQIEAFQTGLINKDIALSLLRHDIVQQWSLPKLDGQQLLAAKLQADIHAMSQDIAAMKIRINGLRTNILLRHLSRPGSASA